MEVQYYSLLEVATMFKKDKEFIKKEAIKKGIPFIRLQGKGNSYFIKEKGLLKLIDESAELSKEVFDAYLKERQEYDMKFTKITNKLEPIFKTWISNIGYNSNPNLDVVFLSSMLQLHPMVIHRLFNPTGSNRPISKDKVIRKINELFRDGFKHPDFKILLEAVSYIFTEEERNFLRDM